jgi:hypothetical protein
MTKFKKLIEVWEQEEPFIEKTLLRAQKEHGESWAGTNYTQLFPALLGSSVRQISYDVLRKVLACEEKPDRTQIREAIVYLLILIGILENQGAFNEN